MNADGLLSNDEFRALMSMMSRHRGTRFSDAELDRLFRAADLRDNGHLDVVEVMLILSQLDLPPVDPASAEDYRTRVLRTAARSIYAAETKAVRTARKLAAGSPGSASGGTDALATPAATPAARTAADRRRSLCSGGLSVPSSASPSLSRRSTFSARSPSSLWTGASGGTERQSRWTRGGRDASPPPKHPVSSLSQLLLAKRHVPDEKAEGPNPISPAAPPAPAPAAAAAAAVDGLDAVDEPRPGSLLDAAAAEVDQLALLLARFDTSRRGRLSRDEFRQLKDEVAVAGGRRPFTELEHELLWASVDRDESGWIDLNELYNHLHDSSAEINFESVGLELGPTNPEHRRQQGVDAGQRARRPSEAAADRAAARAAAARVEAYLAQQAVAASSVTRQGGKQSGLGQARGQQLGEAELRALAELFDDLDTDHTGSLDLKQFRSLLTLLAQRVAARDVDGVVYGLREAHTIFAASDLDSSGSLDFPEFIALLADASGGLAIDAGMGHKIGQAVLREAMDGVQGRKSVLGSLEETSPPRSQPRPRPRPRPREVAQAQQAAPKRAERRPAAGRARAGGGGRGGGRLRVARGPPREHQGPTQHALTPRARGAWPAPAEPLAIGESLAARQDATLTQR